LETLWHDVRFGVKSWLRHPATTVVALLTLALGIGANSAIFSVVNGVLLAPLGFPHADRLVLIWESNPQLNLPRFSVSALNYQDWRRQSRTFETMVALSEASFNVTGGERPEAINGARVAADFFRAVGVEPMLGRGFRSDEDRPGQSRVAVISHGLWQRRFGSDPAVLERSIVLDGQPTAIIGVMPRGFDFYRGQDLWVPLVLDPGLTRGEHSLAVLGRLKPGVSMARGRAELRDISRRLAEQYPDTNRGWTTALISFPDSLVEDVRPRLLLLLWTVAFVLLIACANVANLLLARIASRERELAVRAALGAGRGRLVRQMLTETLILFLAGGALGLALGAWSTRALLAVNPEALPRAGEVGLDVRVVGFTFGLALLTGLAFGLVPALSATGGRLYGVLKEGGRALAGGAQGRLVRSLLVLAEVAIALVLLVGAALLVRSFSRLLGVDPGLRPQGVLTAQVSLPGFKYSDAEARKLFYRRLLSRLAAVPGVERAAGVYPLPFLGQDVSLAFVVQGRPYPRPEEAPIGATSAVTPGYFAAMGVPLLSGRGFAPQDDAQAIPVVVINKTMADEVWPGESPLGKEITMDNPRQPRLIWRTVVGVVGDVRGRGLDRDSGYQIYVPVEQQPVASIALVLRGGRGHAPQTLARPLRDVVAQLDADLPVDHVQPMSDVVGRALTHSRFQTVLLGLFAGLALVLAAIGVYGVVSYSVAQRTHEIGIRMALGAQRSEVLRLILRQGMSLVLLGLAAGLVLWLVLSSLLAAQAETFLFRVSATDPLTLLTVSLALLAVASLANLVPARRATRVDPLVALRTD
jgi:putative ABC transport system permease protein